MSLSEDIRELQLLMREQDAALGALKDTLNRHEEQISGERGLSAAINQLGVDLAESSRAEAEAIGQLRKAAYWVGGLIVAGSISFAFSVLTLFQ